MKKISQNKNRGNKENKKLKKNLDKRNEKKAIGRGAILGAVPACILTTGNNDVYNLATVSWTGIINTKDPMLYVSLRKERYSHKLIKENSHFILNVMEAKDWVLVDYVGTRSGSKEDQLNQGPRGSLKFTKSLDGYPPLLDLAAISLACTVKESKMLGTHEMFLASIDEVFVNASLMNEKNALDLNEVSLLLYAHGSYFEMGRRLGSFGEARRKSKIKRQYDYCLGRSDGT